MNKKIILDLCGGSGSWSNPYKEAGYSVINITLPQYDVRQFCFYDGILTFPAKDPMENLGIKKEDIYGILAAPPCTHFALSGAQYWKQKDADGRTFSDTSILTACLMVIAMVKPKFWVIENPVGRMRKLLGMPMHIFNPCDYGDPYTKKTCLWGDFSLPRKNPIKPEFIIANNGDKYSLTNWSTGGKSGKTKEKRSITPPGFAQAFFKANQ